MDRKKSIVFYHRRGTEVLTINKENGSGGYPNIHINMPGIAEEVEMEDGMFSWFVNGSRQLRCPDGECWCPELVGVLQSLVERTGERFSPEIVPVTMEELRARIVQKLERAKAITTTPRGVVMDAGDGSSCELKMLDTGAILFGHKHHIPEKVWSQELVPWRDALRPYLETQWKDSLFAQWHDSLCLPEHAALRLGKSTRSFEP